MSDIVSFLKKEYKKITGNALSLTASEDIDILVQSTSRVCLLYTSDAADDLLCVDLGGRRII